jgi:agmatinase
MNKKMKECPEELFCMDIDSSKIVLLPVPFDKTSTWLKGADKGPEAIFSAMPYLENYDIETKSEVSRQGINIADPIISSDPEIMAKEVCKKTTSLLEKEKFVVVVGGEHSVSIGAIKAHISYYGKDNPAKSNICVLQLDAHADLREEYHSSGFNHACVMARAKESCPIFQVGIRSMDAKEAKPADLKNIYFAHDIHSNNSWIDSLIKKMPRHVYVTIDLDVFDTSIMPSTGTPEPGGLGWYQVLTLMKRIAEKKELIGFDVVELCPDKTNKAPNFLAGKLIYKILSYKFNPKNQTKKSHRTDKKQYRTINR